MKRLNEELNQSAAPAEKQKKFRLPLSAYLSYLLVACLLVMGVTFSGYVSSAGGSDSARVAKFKVTSAGEVFVADPITASLEPGETVIKQFDVTNSSETTVECFVDFTYLTGNLPLSCQVLNRGGAPFNGTIAMGETGKFDIKISWPITGVADRSPQYANMVDQIQFKLTAQQVD